MSKFFIRRPIFAIVISIIIVLLGTISLLSLPIAQYPQISPPTINIFEQDIEGGCDLDYCANEARDVAIDVAISNSFGFGGTNGTLVFKKFEG